MCYEAEKWARAQTVGNSTAKAVLKELAFRRNKDSGLCCPSLKTLCQDLEIKKRDTVLAAVQRLEAAGFIQREIERAENGEILRTLYTFPTFKPEEWADKPNEETYHKNRDTVSQKSGHRIPKKGTPYPEKQDTVSRKTGDRYPENRDVTIEIKPVIEPVTEPMGSPAATASASEPTLFPEVDQPKPKKSRRKPQVPCPWKPGTPLPENLKEWADENYPTLNAEQVFQEFIGWMIAKDVRNAVWDQAFRNWMANELKKQAKRGGYYRESRKPVDRSHFAHEKPFSQKDFSMTEQEKRDMAYIFALDAQEKAEKERAATGAKE